MYEIVFYEDESGYSPVLEWLNELKNRPCKRTSILLSQFRVKANYLKEFGTRAKKKDVEFLRDGIWQIRPGRNRVLLCMGCGNKIILLHQILKQTKTTPDNEIEKARRERDDWLRRHGK